MSPKMSYNIKVLCLTVYLVCISSTYVY